MMPGGKSRHSGPAKPFKPMSIPENRLAYLFHRYYKKTATAAQREELMELLRGAGDEQLSELLRQAWEGLPPGDRAFSPGQSEDLLARILQARTDAGTGTAAEEGMARNAGTATEARSGQLHLPRKQIDLPWKKIAAAAVIVLAAGAGVYFHESRAPETSVAVATPLNDVPPGGNRAVLTLADGSVIALDEVAEGMLARQGSTAITKVGDGRVAYEGGDNNAETPAPVFNTISTPKGGQYQVVLPDGTGVWLNAASSIRFPAVFSGEERRVEITGEVYFEVARNESMPFRVAFRDGEVEVLGTVFNIMAYENEAQAATTLLEGSVKITARRSPETQRKLSPGQQALMNGSGNLKVVSGADVEAAVAWKNGLFQFTDAGIEEIMRQAARWYNVQVRYEGPVPVRQFTGKISRNVNISELLNMLDYAGVHSRIEGKEIIISP